MKRDVISDIWSEVTPRSSKSSRKTSCLPGEGSGLGVRVGVGVGVKTQVRVRVRARARVKVRGRLDHMRGGFDQMSP